MKSLIINDTQHYHSGSFVVNQKLKSLFKTENILPNKYKPSDKELKEYDIIICNGEGTMHSNKARARHNIKILQQAHLLGIKTALVNTVWQDMNTNIDFIDYVSVRETLSKKEMETNRTKQIDINLDLSFYYDQSAMITQENDIVYGADFENNQIDIFKQSWDYIVNILKKSNLLITKRHHEMYAACKAHCPFIVFGGNTHKNHGLIKTFDSKIPILNDKQELEYYIKHYKDLHNEYNKLFQNMKQTSLNYNIQ